MLYIVGEGIDYEGVMESSLALVSGDSPEAVAKSFAEERWENAKLTEGRQEDGTWVFRQKGCRSIYIIVKRAGLPGGFLAAATTDLCDEIDSHADDPVFPEELFEFAAVARNALHGVDVDKPDDHDDPDNGPYLYRVRVYAGPGGQSGGTHYVERKTILTEDEKRDLAESYDRPGYSRCTVYVERVRVTAVVEQESEKASP